MRFSWDRILFAASALAAFFLFFLAGAISAYYQYPPYGWIYEADTGYRAMREKEKAFTNTSSVVLKNTDFTPVDLINTDAAYKGYTLTTVTPNSAVLLDMQGKVVHVWEKKFSQIWPDHPQLKRPVPDRGIDWVDAQLFPNGDILAVAHGLHDTPYGYGLVKLDKDSNIIWRYDANAHHRIMTDDNGVIYTLTQRLVRPDMKDVKFDSPVIIEDYLTILSADGKELKKLSVLEALNNSPYRKHEYASVKNRIKGDVTHANSVMPLSADLAKKFPMFKKGQILVSLRNMGLIGVVDMDLRTFVWATTGPWRMQHDAEFRPDGTITLFDNLGNGKGRSRVAQYDIASGKTRYLYQGDKKGDFYTNLAGMQQFLPGGNILITESYRKRLFEISPEGEIVWQVRMPKPYGNTHFSRRYAPQNVPFLREAISSAVQ